MKNPGSAECAGGNERFSYEDLEGVVSRAGRLVVSQEVTLREDRESGFDDEYAREATFERLAADCVDQGVFLHQRIQTAGYRRRSSLGWSHDPNGFLAAITEVGTLQRTPNEMPLVSMPVALPPAHKTLVEQGSPTHVLEAVLAGMLNATLQPVENERPDRLFSCTLERGCDVCGASEPYWAQVFAQMGVGEDEQLSGCVGLVGYQIVEDSDGQAIMVRKAVGIRSTLVVAGGVSIDGMPIPPGSLLHTETARDKFAAYGVSAQSVPKHEHSVLPTSDIAHATFMRLSSYAVAPDDRLDLFAELGDQFSHDSQRQFREVLLDYPVRDIQQLAQSSLGRLRRK